MAILVDDSAETVQSIYGEAFDLAGLSGWGRGRRGAATASDQLRPVAGDTAEAEAIKVVSRAHKTLIWERTRHTQRLRHALRDYFPAALEAFTDLDAADTLELLAKAPDPASAAKLTIPQITAALKRARRHDIPANAATTRAAAAVLTVLHEQIKALQGAGRSAFWPAPGR